MATRGSDYWRRKIDFSKRAKRKRQKGQRIFRGDRGYWSRV